jgi:hypothetical protein
MASIRPSSSYELKNPSNHSPRNNDELLRKTLYGISASRDLTDMSRLRITRRRFLRQFLRQDRIQYLSSVPMIIVERGRMFLVAVREGRDEGLERVRELS